MGSNRLDFFRDEKSNRLLLTRVEDNLIISIYMSTAVLIPVFLFIFIMLLYQKRNVRA